MMKRTILFLALLSGFVSAAPTIIEDEALISQFDRKLGALKDAGDADLASGEALLEQLKSRKKAQIDLPAGEPLAPGSNLYESVSPSIFIIGSIYKCDRCDLWHRSGAATAWALSSDGVMVSNYHVFEKAATQAAFGVMNSKGDVYPVTEVLAASADADVAIFRVRGKGFKPLTLKTYIPVGARVNLISHPDGRFYYYTQGRIARYYANKYREMDRGIWLQVTLEYAKGSSGGPIFDDRGYVAGMVSSTNSIYYGSKRKNDKGPFQMVVRNCPSAQLIQDLIESP